MRSVFQTMNEKQMRRDALRDAAITWRKIVVVVAIAVGLGLLPGLDPMGHAVAYFSGN